MPGPPHTCEAGWLGEGSGICISKSFLGAYTHRWGWHSLSHSSNHVDFTSQISQIHPLVVHFYCSWFGSSHYNLPGWQKQLPYSSFLPLVRPPNCHQIYFCETQIQTCHPSALNPPMVPLQVNDGACLFLRWWWRTAAPHSRQDIS